MTEKICKNCSYYFADGFCTYHLWYPGENHTCPKFTTEELELDYDFLYRRCKDYIKICEMYNDFEKIREEHPNSCALHNMDGVDFFLQCCLNDLKRELAKWTLKK